MNDLIKEISVLLVGAIITGIMVPYIMTKVNQSKFKEQKIFLVFLRLSLVAVLDYKLPSAFNKHVAEVGAEHKTLQVR